MLDKFPFECKYLPVESAEETPSFDSWKISENWDSFGNSMSLAGAVVLSKEIVCLHCIEIFKCNLPSFVLFVLSLPADTHHSHTPRWRVEVVCPCGVCVVYLWYLWCVPVHTPQAHTPLTHHRHTPQTRTTDTHHRHTPCTHRHTPGTHHRHTIDTPQTHTTDRHNRHTQQTHVADTPQTHTTYTHLTHATEPNAFWNKDGILFVSFYCQIICRRSS